MRIKFGGKVKLLSTRVTVVVVVLGRGLIGNYEVKREAERNAV